MANYYNYLTKNGIPLKAVLVRLYNSSGQLIDTATTDQYGFYEFIDVPQGTYEIRFYGNQLKKSDWLYNVNILNADELDAGTQSGLAIVPTITPSDFYIRNTTGSITMGATLYENGVPLSVSDVDNYSWLSDGNVFGDYNGPSKNVATISAAQISGIARISCAMQYNSNTYTAYIGLADILDGADGDPGPTGPAGDGTFVATMTTNSGLIFKTSDDGGTYIPAEIELTANLYKATEIVDNPSIEYYWTVNNNHVLSGYGTSYRQFTVVPEMISGIGLVTCQVYSGVNGPFTAQQSITDVFDGTSFLPVIVSSTGGDTFLEDEDGNYTPVALLLTAILYQEGQVLTNDKVTYAWTVDGVSRGSDSNALIVFPDWSEIESNSVALVKCVITYDATGENYNAFFSIKKTLVNDSSFNTNILTPSGVIFKYTNGSYSPSSIDVYAQLYKGASLVDESNITYNWFINGVASGLDQPTFSLLPGNVDESAIIKAELTYSGIGIDGTTYRELGPFIDEINVYDVQDGIDAIYPHVHSVGGTTFISGISGYTPETITLSGALYQGGTAITAGMSFQWYLNDLSSSIGGATASTYEVVPENMSSESERYLLEVTYNSQTYVNERTITRIGTGQSGESAYYLVPDIVSGSATLSYDAPSMSVFAKFYVGGNNEAIDGSALTYSWELDSVEISTNSGLTLTIDDVDLSASLNCTATISGISRSFPLPVSLLDLTDAVEQYQITPKIGSSSYTAHAISVSELRNHSGYSPIGRAELIITGITSTQGQIKSVGLEYASTGNTNFKELAVFNVNIPSGTVNYANSFEFTGIPVIAPNDVLGDTYDFRLYAYNAFGTPALIWGSSDWDEAYLSDTGVGFLGQNYFRYTVPNLELSDDGGKTWISTSPSGSALRQLQSNNVLLRWSDVASRNVALTQTELGSDYIENWEGYPIDSFNLSVEEIKSIASYAVIAKIYQDTRSPVHGLTGANTASGIMGDGPGTYLNETNYSYSDLSSWRLLKNIPADSPLAYTNSGLVYTKLQIPDGRAISLHTYMLVDKAPIITVDQDGNYSKIKLDILEEEIPENG